MMKNIMIVELKTSQLMIKNIKKEKENKGKKMKVQKIDFSFV